MENKKSEEEGCCCSPEAVAIRSLGSSIEGVFPRQSKGLDGRGVVDSSQSSFMVEEGLYQRVALESPSQSPTQSSDHLLDNKCVQSSASSSSDNLDVTTQETHPKTKVRFGRILLVLAVKDPVTVLGFGICPD